MQYHYGYSNIIGGGKVVADKIRMLRERSGMTQSDLARRLGITRSSVNAWEMGLSIPSTQYIVELAEIFKVSTDYLLDVEKTATIRIDGLSQKEVGMISELISHFRSKKGWWPAPVKREKCLSAKMDLEQMERASSLLEEAFFIMWVIQSATAKRKQINKFYNFY